MKQLTTTAMIAERAAKALGTVGRMILPDEEPTLAAPWQGNVYLHISYRRGVTERWARHLRQEYEAGRVAAFVALLPARPDTRWWKTATDFPGVRVCFIRHRVRFGPGRGGAPFPSAVVYVGPDPDGFREVFEDIGTVYQELLAA